MDTWCKGQARDHARALARKHSNGRGFHDMHGNVQEWCADTYRDSREPAAAPAVDRLEPARHADRVLRGGRFACPKRRPRSAYRMADALAASVQHDLCPFKFGLAMTPRSSRIIVK